ncbi:MAG: xanthine dehydrogenase family protein subunit M [Deltaproteobacteria bacterium]|nr:xanthine dehydrogenase family protein subunit M [Deltaproteobacteria bacterium]MBW2122266.1 xanthine dehydrogenase family protein subunit M [Deltaproteobacteria bacterium]
MVKFGYLKPRSIDEAISLYEKHRGKAKYIAGGTDVMVKIKEGRITPRYLISLNHLEGLDRIVYDDGELKIGSMVTHRMLELSPLIKKRYPILADAVENIGSVQIRNVATIGGNIVNAVPSADGAIPLITLGARVRVRGPSGEREMALEELFVGPGQTVLDPGEILLEFVVPELPPRTGGAYWKHTRRAAMELPLLGVAVLVSLAEDMETCTLARIGLGVLAPTPMRARRAESILTGERLDEGILKEAGRVAAEECKARDTVRGEAWYRRAMVRVLVPRMARIAMERAS